LSILCVAFSFLALAETKAEPRNESKGERTKCAAYFSYLSNGYLIVEVLDYSVLPGFYIYTFTDVFPKQIKIVPVFIRNPFMFCKIYWLLYHKLWSDHHSSDAVGFVTKWTAVHSDVKKTPF